MYEYKISVIVPIYNAEKYIEHAILSLLNQSIGFEVLEVIIVDDCSTDRSGLIIDEYANRYDNIKVIHLEKNSGLPGKPRNKGLEVATCEYVMFLDQDDFFDKNACEILYNKIEATDADVAFGYYNYVNEENVIIDRNPTSDKYVNYLNDDSSDFEVIDLKDKLNFVIPLFNKIYKRELIEKNNIKFQESVLGEDRIFACEYFMLCERIVYENALILNYRLRNKGEKSTSQNMNVNFFLSVMDSYKLMYKVFLKYDIIEHFRIVFDECVEDIVFRILASRLDDKELILVIENLYNLINYVEVYTYNKKFVYINLILDELLKKEFNNVLNILKKIIPVYEKLNDSYIGNAWINIQLYNENNEVTNLLKIIDCMKKENTTLKKEIIGLKNINFELKKKYLKIEKDINEIVNTKTYKVIKKFYALFK
ncbi:glycosyltransferase family 2 protein [Clostridioides sp. ZZV14-6045]|uniref:glycosyltransferase family 2 protein n=1 Tax=Clostridioides sp. ZZV14-6045 TaxID=2811489 RepID=UPI001D12BA4C|nr:glycosyltransferase family 2 protein [Clostridioides sp. ZZV14-6045]